MYDVIDNRSGSTIIKPMFIMLATAASISTGYANAYNNIEMKDDIVIQPQRIGKINDINPYIKSSRVSFYDAISQSDNTMSELITIIKKCSLQMERLNFISIDLKLDEEIDKYFANRKSKRAKKIIYKRNT